MVSAGHPQRHRKLSRSGAKLPQILCSSRLLHLLDAFDRLQRANQHKAQTLSLNEDVKHPVHSVIEVDIGRSGLMARDKNSRTWTKDRMARLIAVHIISFRFDHDSAESAPLQRAPNQFPRATQRVTLEETALQHGMQLAIGFNRCQG